MIHFDYDSSDVLNYPKIISATSENECSRTNWGLLCFMNFFLKFCFTIY